MTSTNYKSRHYYNNVLFTPWPFLMSMFLFILIFVTILVFNKFIFINITCTLYVILTLLYIIMEIIIAWSEDVISESYYGKYTKKLRSAIAFGFFLFLLSEIMLFGSFFWTYFDRLFHLTYVTGFLSVPTTVENIRWFKEPLYATIVLLTSGWMSNCALYMYKSNDTISLQWAYFFSLFSNLLGCVFLYIQFLEYSHLTFSISDSVFCSIFFTLTGFHGLHVIIGNIFLFNQYYLKYKYYDNKVHGLSLAILYWHLVDIIWIILFITLYVFNNIDYLVASNLEYYYN